METRKEFAKGISKKISWADIFTDPNKIKVEMFWRLYAEQIFKGVEVSTVQYQETKQAYFVGFSECFKIMTDISERFDENQASDILSDLARESNQYIDSLIDRTLK